MTHSGDGVLDPGNDPTSTARARDGGVSVTTTSSGLPLAIDIADTRLSRQPQALADEILRLSRRSAMAAGVRLRARLEESGTPIEVIDCLALPRPEDLAIREAHDDAVGEAETDAEAPVSWLRSV